MGRFSRVVSLWSWLVGGWLMGTALIAHAEEPRDPHAWLEDVEGQQSLDWVRKQNESSTRPITSAAGFEPLRTRLLEILNSTARIPMISKAGPHYYNFWRDAKHRKGLWRRTTLEEYRKAEPAWETVLDLDALAADEKENWVWKGANFLEPACERVLISLSRGGADAVVIREFDVVKKQFVADGFTLPEAKSRVAWRGIDSLFVATNFGPDSLTDSGYPRTVREWKRGTPLENAPEVFAGQKVDVSVSAWRDLTPGFERDFVGRGVTFWTNELYLRRDSGLVKLAKPDDAKASVHREWLLLELRSDWQPADQKYLAGSLLAIQLEQLLAGQKKFDVLFAPTDRRSLDSVTPTRHHLILNVLDNVRDRIEVLTPVDGQWRRGEIAGMPEFGSVSITAVDERESDDYFVTIADYLTPTTLKHGSVGRGAPETLKSNPKFFDASNLVIHQREATSKDGTKIPYFEVSRADLKLDGQNPTLLYGYGGFEIPLVPGYQAQTGAAWLERGGVYVVANIRGGGEFGPRWHQAALKQNRHRAYEDFAAVAEDLVRRKVTSPKRLGAMGGSNGGLLMGNMLTLFPQHFGAIVCQVPLLDMRRYNRLLAGASWMAEYGDPDDPKQWEFIRTFSPYHNLKSEAKYPSILVTTSTRDDRVHPGHARKFVARLQELGHPVSYYENIEGGHGGAADNPQTAYMWALAYSFLWRELTDSPPSAR